MGKDNTLTTHSVKFANSFAKMLGTFCCFSLFALPIDAFQQSQQWKGYCTSNELARAAKEIDNIDQTDTLLTRLTEQYGERLDKAPLTVHFERRLDMFVSVFSKNGSEQARFGCPCEYVYELLVNHGTLREGHGYHLDRAFSFGIAEYTTNAACSRYWLQNSPYGIRHKAYQNINDCAQHLFGLAFRQLNLSQKQFVLLEKWKYHLEPHSSD